MYVIYCVYCMYLAPSNHCLGAILTEYRYRMCTGADLYCVFTLLVNHVLPIASSYRIVLVKRVLAWTYRPLLPPPAPPGASGCAEWQQDRRRDEAALACGGVRAVTYVGLSCGEGRDGIICYRCGGDEAALVFGGVKAVEGSGPHMWASAAAV
jgi:hypothetical protein